MAAPNTNATITCTDAFIDLFYTNRRAGRQSYMRFLENNKIQFERVTSGKTMNVKLNVDDYNKIPALTTRHKFTVDAFAAYLAEQGTESGSINKNGPIKVIVCFISISVSSHAQKRTSYYFLLLLVTEKIGNGYPINTEN